MKEYRVTGPPGCGKSTYIRRQCKHAADTYGPQKVVVCSLTRAAAANLIEKEISIPHDNVGTLHSLAYRALPGVDIAETHLQEFNDFCNENRQPGMKLGIKETDLATASTDNDIVSAPIGNQGDQLLQQMNINRARMIDRAVWPEGVKAFAKWWDRWKQDNGYVDFTDLLEISLRDVAKCPGEPAALMADESQDFTKLAFTLARKWGEQCETWIQVGDADQLLFYFCGATIDSFLVDLPPEQTRVLHQSYRVPRSVHSYAVKWIEGTPGRSAVHYEPREAAGAVRRLSARYVEPTAAVADCQRQIAAGRSCMFLVSCSYMLSKIIAMLRDGGIPFHNPYRVSRGDWNPLRIGANSPAARLAAFNVLQHEKRIWTNQELWRWVEWLPTATLQRGSKTSIQRDAKDCPGGVRDGVAVLRLFKPEFGNAVMDGDQAWFLSMIDEESKRKLAYPLRIAERCGVAALQETPQVIVSTIHAAKGGEADCSPPDEPILTTQGWIPISELDPERHRLVSYAWHTDKIRAGIVRNASKRPDAGYSFSVASRPYNGRMLVLATGKSVTRITPNHYLTCRFSQRSKSAYIVYLMRRGNWWRVGLTNDLVCRSTVERCDCAWILGMFDNRQEASQFEMLTSTKWGISMATFRSSGRNANDLTQDQLCKLHDSLSDESTNRAIALLDSLGQSIDWPFHIKTNHKGNSVRKSCHYRFKIRACNFVQGFMEIPVCVGKQKPAWIAPIVSEYNYDGLVYSLNVEPYHHYISGGAVVHNCVYVFPDLSPQGYTEWMGGKAGKEGVRRAFYVALTRAREELVICQAASTMAVRL